MSCRRQGDFHSFVCLLKLGFKPQGWNLSLQAGSWASKLRFKPWEWDLSLEARIWAWRLGFEPGGWDLSPEAKGERTDKQTNERMNEQTNQSPPVFYRTSSPLGPLPKKPLTDITYKDLHLPAPSASKRYRLFLYSISCPPTLSSVPHSPARTSFCTKLALIRLVSGSFAGDCKKRRKNVKRVTVFFVISALHTKELISFYYFY